MTSCTRVRVISKCGVSSLLGPDASAASLPALSRKRKEAYKDVYA